MKIGIAMFPADFATRPDEMAIAVEERGFESLFFTEHTHVPRSEETDKLDPYFSHTFDLFVSVGWALSATSRLLVGTGVMLGSEHDPFNAAKALASLDVLSSGRLLVGVGASWIDQELVDHGFDPARRWGVLIEHIEAVKAIWANDVAEFHGRFVDFGPVYSWPKPFRPDGPPILVGGNGPRVLERVVAHGDEWFPEDEPVDEPFEVEELASRIADLQGRARLAGREPIPVSLFGTQPQVDRLKRVEEAGVHRAVIYAPAVSREAMLPYLDEVAAVQSALAG